MRYALLLLAGCAKGACPSVEALDKTTTPEDHDADVLIHADCVEHGWPSAATDCFNNAKDTAAAEACFKLLSAEDRKRLNDKIDEVYKPRQAQRDAAERRASEALFTEKLAHVDLGASPECTSYLAAIKATMTRLRACPRHGQLAEYGDQQQILAAIAKLDADKPARCKAAEAALATMTCE